MWYATADCTTCRQTFGGLSATPCKYCRPVIHPFNDPIVILYDAVRDQYIGGFDSPIGLNDLAIIAAMKFYFKVRKRERLKLSKDVRRFGSSILKIQRERKKSNGNTRTAP